IGSIQLTDLALAPSESQVLDVRKYAEFNAFQQRELKFEPRSTAKKSFSPAKTRAYRGNASSARVTRSQKRRSS
ncbi:MAG: hypothetical protein Q4D05_05000, partial [Acinetobacter sp.]|nr:hypothetical protein [Acinetobacter sp.]